MLTTICARIKYKPIKSIYKPMNIPKHLEMYRKDLQLKNYSENTIKNYCFQVESFLKSNANEFTEPSKINEQSIKNWLLQFKTRNAMCHSISALKLFYKMTIKQPMKFRYIEYPRSEKKLPRIIEKQFLLEKLAIIENIKHKAILTLAYSTGMRVSEVINLKIADVDSKRMIITIRQSKGRKDRVVCLTEKVLEILRKYFIAYKPQEYLFNGQDDRTQYSSTSCNAIVKQYLGKEYHFHLLRHSNATALLEAGTDIRIIQKHLGHSSSKTTEIYTHVSTNILQKMALPI
jgi:site-specific recombinase XerD